MAPGLRSDGRAGHAEVVGACGADPGGCSPQRTDAGGEKGRCLRTRLRDGAAGMLANCLLSVAVLLLVVQCAVAAEEKSTYDASGSPPLPIDPSVTDAPVHPLADLSVAEETPFPVVHSDGDSESEREGLSGQPAFSSVLTVMAGTVKHPASLDHSRTLPSISKDETQTTQWPSRSSSQGLDMSSSPSFVGDKIHKASSGLIFNLSDKHTIPLVAIGSAISKPSHESLMDRKTSFSSFPFLSLTSMSSSVPSTSSLTSSLVSLLFRSSSTERINKAALSQSQGIVSSSAAQTETATLSPAGPEGGTDSRTTAKSTSHSVGDLHAVRQGMQNAARKPSNFPSEASSENSNKMTKHSLYSPEHKMNHIYIRSATTNVIHRTASNTFSSYPTPNNSLNLSDDLYRPTQNQNKSLNSVSANNLEISLSTPFNQESQAVQRQQGATQNPTSARLSARPKSYSVSSHVTQQMLHGTAYTKEEDRTAVDNYTLVDKSNVAALPFSSHVVNPTVTPTMTFTPSRWFFTISSGSLPDQTSLSQTAVAKQTRIHSGIVASEYASNPGDLVTAAGHSSSSLPAININYNQGRTVRAELTSTSTQAHLSNSLSLTLLRPEHTNGSVLRSSTGEESPSSTSESALLRDIQELVTQSSSFKGVTHRGLVALKMILTPSNRSTTLSEPADFSKYMTYKAKHQSSSHLTQPTGLSFSNNSIQDDIDDSTEVYVNKETNSAAQISPSKIPLQTRSLLTLPLKFHTPALPSPAKSSASMKSEGTTEVQTSAGNYEMSNMSNGKKSSVPPVFNGKEESALIRDSASYKTGVPSGQLKTQLLSFKTSEDFMMLNKGSQGSGKRSAEIPSPSVTLSFLQPAKYHDDATFASHLEQSFPSSWSEIILTQRESSSSLGAISSYSSDKSHSFLDRQTSIDSNGSSAVTTSSSDGQNSGETSTIFSFGTKVMALYTKWRATKPMPLQSSAFKSENVSAGFDREISNLPADGSSYEYPSLKNGQEHSVYILNSNDSTAVTSDLYPLYSTVREHPSFTYVFRLSDNKEQTLDLSPAYLKSAKAVNKQPRVKVNTAATSARGSDVSLPLSYIATDTETSSQATSLALVYKSKKSPPLADVHSPESAFELAVSLPDDIITNIVLKRSTSSTDLVSSFTSFHPSSSLETFSSSASSQLSSLYVKPTTSVSLLPTPTMYPGEATSSVSVKPTFSSSSPTLTSSLDSIRSQVVTEMFDLTEAETDESTAETSKSVVLSFPKEKEASLAPSQSDRITLFAGPTQETSQVSLLTPQQDTTTASAKLPATTVASTTKSSIYATPPLRVPTQSTSTTTPRPTPVTRRTTTTTISRRTFTPPVPRTSPPRGVTTVFISPFTTTTTEAPPPQCNITERLWVKTVVSIYVRRNRLDSIQRQNLRRGLSQGLRKALNDTSAQAQVETVFGSPNMTVAYHVTGGDIVYLPSAVMEALAYYGRDKLIADLRQYLPLVTALPLPVALWRPSPATGFQLKTVLQFVGAVDKPRSCRFSQMMEQRLEKVFSEAQAKVFNSMSRLSVQMLSVSQAAGSPAVSLVYTVRNGTVYINGTAASNLLGQLSAELVGYFLFYPPLIIAEPLEYHNLNTSIATRDFWVVTVIQDVDNASLEGQYQSFASLMEQRVAELFVLAGQQGTRFRRATAVGSYTVQMVSIRRVSGLKNPAEMTYYVQHNGIPLSGTSAAKVLNTVDSQTMALTLGYFVQLQAEPVVKNPSHNLWIIAAVLAPISVVTLIIIIITAVLCRKNKSDFKADAIGNLNPRAKMAYRRDVGYYHQPVQGFDYAKQHLGQQGGDEETLPVSQDTLVMSLQIRDTSLSLEKALQKDGTANKKSLTADKHKSKLPSEDGSVISNESEKPNSGRGLTVPKVTAQQKLTKEETRKRDDPYDTSSGSLQLISIKPMAAQTNYSHPASSDHSQDSAIVNGEVNLALKQKSDIEHYRNKLRLKAKKKGYYDFPSTNGGSSGGRALAQRQQYGNEGREADERGRPLEPDDERGSTYVKSHRRHSQVGQMAYRSRQSLSSPSPGGTEMDLLVMRERPRRGIRNSGYDTEPELIEETNVDHLMGLRGHMYGRGLKGQSQTSTLSSQPSIDEVRQQMHLLLEEAFSLASGGQSTSGRHSHHHQPHPDHYSSAPPPLPYSEVVTSAPGTMSSGRGGLQWVPPYGTDMYQCSLPKPAFRFTQLPEMTMGSPPPLPPRSGPPPRTSLRRSTSDLGPKGRSSETSVAEMRSQHENNPYGPTTRAALPSITAEQPVSNYSGNPITAVFSIPATRPGYSEYFVSTSPTSYHSPSWMSYPPEPEDVPPQWADSVPLPGYVEAFPNPRYPQGSPTRLPLQYHQTLEQPPTAPSTASEQNLPQVLKDMDSMPLSSLSTSALVQAIRQEVAKLAKKQNDVFEF